MKKAMLLCTILFLSLSATSVMATGAGDSIERRFDYRGDRINRHLDNMGKRINGRLDHRAAIAYAHGHEVRAARLDMKGNRIENRLDRKGDRVDRRLDRRGCRIDRRFDRWILLH